VTEQPKTITALSYAAHERGYDEYRQGGSKGRQAESWLDAKTIGHWRFERMYRLAAPLLETYPGARWFTVGDGRYGLDARYLCAHGAAALATDISETLLREGKERSVISDYRIENAEQLSFASDSFDVAFCKEAYHHFPRPMLALHEMLRVARRAVLLIEPNDFEFPSTTSSRVSRMLKNMLKSLMCRPTDGHTFEVVGNYVYTISRREMEKVALGIGCPAVAFKGVNDYHLPGADAEPAEESCELFRRVRARIERYDRLCRIGISQWGLLGVVILKEAPNESLRAAFTRHGFDLVILPKNPYLEPRSS
jgi:ubiquinone/menaquinone biosynthesis C-methylase UbiE